MPPRIALAACSLWPTGSGDHAGLAEAVADRGVRADWVPWDDPNADWSDYELVLLRETWDYPAKLASFLAWVDSVAMVTSVLNRPAVVRWNHHKRYLQELSAAGIPTVPTTVVTRGAAEPVAALGEWGAETVVVKPAVGIGGNDAERGRSDDPATAAHVRALLAGGDVLVQPYQESIETSGETSLVVLGGRVSHAVTKLPARGEFRIHEHRGGSYSEVEPTAAQVELALRACEVASALTGEDLIYARADLVAGDGGRPLLMELELIEPSLYLHTVPAATDELADVVITALAP
ncbi:MAG: hypothetical protein KY439_04260 [Actinobacteria bacterium]|nr:hypothetical protein [Actinomycetota bacterium]